MEAQDAGLLGWLVGEAQAKDGVAEGPAKVGGAPPQAALLARFADEGELGRGGMSSVRRVLDRNLERRVAMKVLDPRLAKAPREAARFRAEAQITGQLEHPHIPPLYEFGVDGDGTNYFTMKLVHGRTLHDLLKNPWFSPANEAKLFTMLGILVKVGHAVAYAHGKGVIHLDIKPANVMVGEHGQVYLMDWGISRLVNPPADAEAPVSEPFSFEADEGAVLGTIPYMAPEQARGEQSALDERADVYSLGAVLYRILTGQPPHTAEDRSSLLVVAMQGRVARPEGVRPEIALPKTLCDIAMRALAREPQERYRRVSDFVSDLEGFLRGAGRFEERTFAPGAVVVREGDVADAAFVITAGRCVAFKTVGGVDQPLREMGPGDVFGETAILTDQPRSATVQATTELTVALVTRASLEQEIGQSRWMGRFVRALAERFRDVDERAAQARAEREEAELTGAIFHHFAWHGAGAGSLRVAPWLSLRDELVRRFGQPAAEIDAWVARLGAFRLNVVEDQIAIADSRRRP